LHRLLLHVLCQRLLVRLHQWRPRPRVLLLLRHWLAEIATPARRF